MSSANKTATKRRLVFVAIAVALLWASLGLDFGGSVRQADDGELSEMSGELGLR
jgi:hypothetical protein